MSLDHVAARSVPSSPHHPLEPRIAGGLHPCEAMSRRTCRIVESAVTQVFGVCQADLFKATRGRARIALARQVAMYLTHICFGMTYTEVGQLFGRDRTTVAHACAVVEDRRDDPVFDRTLELLEWVVPSLFLPRPCSHWFGEA